MRPDEMETADRSKPYLFQVETDPKPGKIVCHVLRLETYEFEQAEFEQTTFDILAFHLIHQPPPPTSLS